MKSKGVGMMAQSRRYLLCVSLFSGIMAMAQVACAVSAGVVKETSEKAVQVGIASQRIHESWIEEEHRLLEEIEDLETLLEHIQWHRSKLAIYMKDLKEKIAGLRKKSEAMEAVNMKLLPILEKNLEKMQVRVDKDIPSNLTERHKSIHHARMVLNNYDMGLLDKARAVLDAVAREVDLGHQVNVLEDEIEVDGGDRRVKILQVGRIGLYAMTLDGVKAYQWDMAGDRWSAIESDISDIRDAIDMAEGVRLVGLSKLPVAQPQQLQEEASQ